MSAVQTSIDIAAPPEAVWDFVMDPTNSERWVTIHRGLKDHDTGALKPGFRMDQRLCLRGVNFDVHWTLAEVDPPRYAVWEGKGPARSKARIVEKLSENGDGGTHFEYENEFHAPFGPLGAVATRAVTGGVPRREADASLKRLKAILERATG
jgi:uncharacterized protein YndB with AHSA1/START domain